MLYLCKQSLLPTLEPRLNASRILQATNNEINDEEGRWIEQRKGCFTVLDSSCTKRLFTFTVVAMNILSCEHGLNAGLLSF
jgi:hypothetical protein